MSQQPVTPTASIHLLGGFEMLVDDQAVVDHAWPHRKAKALLKLLALQPGRSLHRERVMELLWPGLDLKSAANNLRKNLHYLRVALAAAGLVGGLILMSQDMLALADGVSLDFVDFVSAANGALASGNNPALYENALALYRGDLLPEDLYVE